MTQQWRSVRREYSAANEADHGTKDCIAVGRSAGASRLAVNANQENRIRRDSPERRH